MGFMNKKGVTFGNIVATLGAILIAVGIIWLIAQNWHQIPDAVKILILIAATMGAYIAGIILRVRNYKGIGNALIILGGLLYTSSIFLIAQIFSTEVTPQGIAWLFFLCWIGVLAASYIFMSKVSLVIALWEFLIWVFIQFIAFVDAAHELVTPGLLAFYFLFVGLLLYGLSLIHRSREHEFAKLYQWWTAFYFLAFTYILSFQVLLPVIWSKDSVFYTPAVILLVIFGIISVAVLIVGIMWAISNKSVHFKEMTGVLAISAVLIVLILLAGFTTAKIGRCYSKQCWDLDTEAECIDAQDQNCYWQDASCQTRECFIIKTKEECENNKENLLCSWSNTGFCEPMNCYNFHEEGLCANAPESLNCYWDSGTCMEKQCYTYSSKEECESTEDRIDCTWDSRYRCIPYEECSNYNNNYDVCKAQSQCKWSDDPFSHIRGTDVPFIVWLIWTIVNIAFLLIILAVIGYGSWVKQSKIINLGIIFFALDIVTRYIGFIIDLWGYTSLSLIFISGGLLLVLGGWFIEKWRRKLVNQTRNT